MTNTDIPWGPTGEVVYNRTYSRTKADGSRETWPETVMRVARGNLGLVYGPPEEWTPEVKAEYDDLVHGMVNFEIIPAGRQLWASGVRGRQYLFNCHVAGWGDKLSDHYSFSFLRLMEGGGVGANYSSPYLAPYGPPRRDLNLHIVCDSSHPDYEEMKAAGYLSEKFVSDWEGAFAIEDSREGWAEALVDLLDTYMTDDTVKHSDRVYDVTRVRGKGAPLRTFGGHASGPGPLARMLHEVSRVMNEHDWRTALGKYVNDQLNPIEAMEIDHAIAECVVSGGNRRSARMSQVHWRDPFIFEFIECKDDTGLHWTTNISVEIDEEFTDHLGWGVDDEQFLTVKLVEDVHNAVVGGMLANGEPGYWNSTTSNQGEPNAVQATNPCGEIALEAWENCNLGHVNLDAFAPTVKDGPADAWGLIKAHRLMTRFLIRATHGDMNDENQAAVVARNRRIGVGHLGVQGFWAKQGRPFSRLHIGMVPGKLLDQLQATVRAEARAYAFQLRIPEPVKVTTVAPTGSIAKLPGVTEGIHPIYARHFLRRVRFSLLSENERKQVAQAAEQGFEVEKDIYDASGNTMVVVYPTKDKLVAEVEAMGIDPSVVEAADEISIEDMLAVQALYQEHYADNAVSFTVNVPEGLDMERVRVAIAEKLPALKGTTVMVDGTRPQAPYERISAADFAIYEMVRVEDGTDEDCATGACPVR